MRVRMGMRSGIRRTTTGMVNKSRKRAGLSSGRSSLLNSVKNRRTGTTSALGGLNAYSVQSAKLERNKYERLYKASGSLTTDMKLLAEKADKGGKNLAAAAADMASGFNDTLNMLKQSVGVLNDFYRQSLKETAAGNRKALEEIGITVATDGTLSVNKEKLAAADEEKVKDVLGSGSDFVKRVSAIAERVSDNAQTCMDGVSGRYTSTGSSTASYFSRYNFKG